MVREGNVRTEAGLERSCAAGLEDRGRQTRPKEHRQPLDAGKGKDADSSLEPLEGTPWF